MVLATMPPFSKSGLQVLAGEYLAGPLLKWDEIKAETEKTQEKKGGEAD
jgi:hypothetical protein